ncbi:MAG: dienelactone hydrolase family protein [Pseudomonadales bacterium]|nr:dienelactone hydrolase family protein [Pseudomonadales bacterium]
MIEWNEATDTSGNPTREFRITREGKRDITGAVWLPAGKPASQTLMCFGHGASGDRYQAPICHLAHRFVTEANLPVLSLDGPVHGLRQVGEGGRTAFFPEFRRDEALTDMTEEWSVAIDAAQALPEIGKGKLAYFGLSMGSIFGIPLVASRDDVVVATLGLFGIQDNFPHGDEFVAAAQKITCPILFLMQLEDELFNREGYLKVFDLFASKDKRIHANPGLHPQIPSEEIGFAFEFLVSHIEGRRERGIVNPLAE